MSLIVRMSAMLVFVLMLSTACHAQFPFNRIDAATFRIETGLLHCSATAVGPHTLLTADHCVVNDGLRVLDIDGKAVEVESIVADGRDHVLLRVKTRLDSWVLIRRAPLSVGEPVSFYGNPGNMRGMLRQGYFSGSQDLILAHPDTNKPWPQAGMQLFIMPSGGGDSGSGIFDANGLLVAVLSLEYRDRVSFTAALPFAFTAEQWADAQK